MIDVDLPRQESTCTATIGGAMEGQFLELRYTWSFEKEPQSGVLMVSTGGETAKAVWFDSWHNADGWMTLEGTRPSPSSVVLSGIYPAGDGSPDWGWRVEMEMGETLAIDMYNITPEGEEMIGVELRLGRA